MNSINFQGFPLPPDVVVPKRALISVFNKTDLEPLARELVKHGIELISTGGTLAHLTKAGLDIQDVTSITGFPEILGGRVKTLHPKIHGGLLGVRNAPEHFAAMQAHDILPIDILYNGLYPFESAVAANLTKMEIVENIDIGGPAMIRAAAKNYGHVAVCVDPEGLREVLDALSSRGGIPLALREDLAARAFARTAAYDTAIATFFAEQRQKKSDRASFPKHIFFSGDRIQELRYGENPHQKGGFYRSEESRSGVATAEQLQGKPLSYNNITDTDAAYELVADFADYPAVAIIKHANPCGVAWADNLEKAYCLALETDPVSAFGGVVALSRKIDARTARKITEIFTEVVIAPDADPEAKAIFAEKKNLRLLLAGSLPDPKKSGIVFRSVAGGFLVQDRDITHISQDNLTPDHWRVVTKRKPTDLEIADMIFAFRVAKHVKSNAIVYAKNGRTVGIGAGQMNRRDSAKIAAIRALETSQNLGLPESLAKGSACASEAFFPFVDGLLEAISAGAEAVIQPGGSIKDAEVIEAADAAGITMVFTGQRVFRH